MKSFGKSRGKSKDGIELTNIVHRIVESIFPDVSATTESINKRGHVVNDDEYLPEQKKGKRAAIAAPEVAPTGANVAASPITSEQNVRMLFTCWDLIKSK